MATNNNSVFAITIEALDQATQVINTINKNLKAMRDAAEQAGSSSDDENRKTHRRFSSLGKGVSEFGKNIRAELSGIAKNFAQVGLQIGSVTDVLERSFKLGGLAVGAGIATKGIVDLGKGIVTTADKMTDLQTLANSLGMKLPQLQKEIRKLSIMDVDEDQTKNVLKTIRDLRYHAMRPEGIPPDVQQMLVGLGIDITKPEWANPAAVLDKVIEEKLKGNPIFTKTPGSAEDIARALGSEDLAKVFNRANAGEQWKLASDNAAKMATLSDKAAQAFDKIHTDSNLVKAYFDDIVKNIETRLGEYLGEHYEAMKKDVKENPWGAFLAFGGLGAGLVTIAARLGSSFMKWFTGNTELVKAIEGLTKSMGEGGIKKAAVEAAEAAAGAAAKKSVSEILGGILGRVFQFMLGKFGGALTDILLNSKPLNEGEEEAVRRRNDEWKKAHPNWGRIPGRDGVTRHRPGHGGAPGASGADAGGSLPQGAYEAIARSEGTMGADGIDYNMLPGGGHADLVNRSISDAMQISREVGDGVGGFQELHSTVAAAAKALGMDINKEKFSPENQRKIADWIYNEDRRRGGNGTNPWHGFNAHPEQLEKFNKAIMSAKPQTLDNVPGGKGSANFGKHSGVLGDPRSPGWAEKNLVTVKSPSGVPFRVHRLAAPSFQGFVNDLEAQGYKIHSGGGYNLRETTGGGSLSEHAFGNAIDINPQENPYSKSKFQTDLPPNVSDVASKWGLTWGGDWKSVKDPMHFEWTGKPIQPPMSDKNRSIFPPWVKRNSRGEAYSPELDTMSAEEKAKTDQSMKAILKSKGHWADRPEKSSSNDSSHKVEVSFNNAPPGMRHRITESNGSADLNLRTRYSLATVG